MMLGHKELTAEEKEIIESRRIKVNRVADGVFLVPAVIIFVFFAKDAVFVGVGVVRTVLWGLLVAGLLAGVRIGRKTFIILTLTLNFIAVSFISAMSLFTFGFSSRSKWKYNSQRKYVDRMHNGHSDCFPNKLPKDIKGYSIDYLPSIMQGTGHFRVHFRTSAQQLEEYEKTYSAQALYTIPLEKFGGLLRVEVEEIAPGAEAKIENDKTIDIAYDHKFWEGHDKDATVYVVSAVHNWNHPHSGAVIINKAEGMVEFTHLG